MMADKEDIKKALESVKKVMLDTRPASAPKMAAAPPPGARPTCWMMVGRSLLSNNNRYDEVYPGIVIGDQTLATNLEELKQQRISHILNASQGPKFNQVDTNEDYYKDSGIKFYGIRAMDIATFKMAPHFQPAADFIENALQDEGRVYVHCHQGISRSATLVLAYLLLKKGKTLEEAVTMIRQKREIYPNDGFLKQLCRLNLQLHPTESPAQT